MFFNKSKRKREIESLKVEIEQVKHLYNMCLDDSKNMYIESEKLNNAVCEKIFKISNLEDEINVLKNIIKDQKDHIKKIESKNISLKAEVSRLNTAKKQLLESKEACQKVIKKNKIKYNRDSRGRFAKKK